MKSFIKYYYRLVPKRFTSPGVQCTWSRGRDHVKAYQIDRFLISTKWNGSFKIIKQLAVSRVISNHKLLLLENEEWYTTHLVYKILEFRAATRRVYWHEEGVVEELYDQCQPRFYPRTKIEELEKGQAIRPKMSLANWKQEQPRSWKSFQLTRLGNKQHSFSTSKMQMVLNLKMELMQLAHDEGIFWRHKFRCMWLKGEGNTRYFQTVANSHIRNNNIDKLKVHYEITNDKEEIKIDILNFCQFLFINILNYYRNLHVWWEWNLEGNGKVDYVVIPYGK